MLPVPGDGVWFVIGQSPLLIGPVLLPGDCTVRHFLVWHNRTYFQKIFFLNTDGPASSPSCYLTSLPAHTFPSSPADLPNFPAQPIWTAHQLTCARILQFTSLRAHWRVRKSIFTNLPLHQLMTSVIHWLTNLPSHHGTSSPTIHATIISPIFWSAS